MLENILGQKREAVTYTALNETGCMLRVIYMFLPWPLLATSGLLEDGELKVILAVTSTLIHRFSTLALFPLASSVRVNQSQELADLRIKAEHFPWYLFPSVWNWDCKQHLEHAPWARKWKCLNSKSLRTGLVSCGCYEALWFFSDRGRINKWSSWVRCSPTHFTMAFISNGSKIKKLETCHKGVVLMVLKKLLGTIIKP